MSAVPLPVITLSATRSSLDSVTSTTGRLQLRISGQPVELELTVPSGATTTGDLLPLFRGITNTVVEIAERDVQAAGKSISCQAGCGACCRQPVPIATSEARDLREWVESRPEVERDAIRSRFSSAIEQLEQAQVLQPFRNEIREEMRSAGLAYFRAGVPCPFLENESCSIHPIRPLACREYLVTSPAKECATPSAEKIDLVPLAAKPSRRLMEMDGRWTLLVLALEEQQFPSPPSRTGPEIAQDFVKRLTSTTI